MSKRFGALQVGRRTAFGGLAALALALGVAPSACSVVVDGSSEQCSSTEECADFPGTECVAGLCETPAIACTANTQCASIEGGACVGGICLAAQNTCETSSECVSANGENWICKRPIAGKKECVSLLNEDCVLVEGEYQNDSAVIIGSVLPILGQENEDTGESSQNGARLALREIQESAGGIPALTGGGGRRPLVLVSCDAREKDVAVRSANYLVDTIGVQAIIGSAFSGVSTGVATEVTIPKGILLFSASATSAALTQLADQDPKCVAACAGDVDCVAGCPGLFWRTSPSDVVQSSALAAYMDVVETRVRDEVPLLATDDIKVLLLHKGDSYGQGIAAALEQKLRINGSLANSQDANYDRFNYGNSDDPQSDPPKYPQAIEAALELAPHVIFVLGTKEGIEEVIAPLEAAWDDSLPYRPTYLMGDGGFIESLITVVDAQPTEAAEDSLRQRLRGSVPGTTPEGNPNFGTFVQSYNGPFRNQGNPTTFGAAGSYDIMYMLAFSAAAARDEPLTGTTFARGLLRMVDGQEISVGNLDLNAGFGIMTNPDGSSMDLQGASGELDFDVVTGEGESDVLIWCMSENASGANEREVDSGLLYVAADDALAGSEENCD